ncbi:MAG: hypothetical protein KDC48_19645 [Planctomycetes bacterium]|nr:hypothetical protein [Planctomycetota bacterium]
MAPIAVVHPVGRQERRERQGKQGGDDGRDGQPPKDGGEPEQDPAGRGRVFDDFA